MRLSTWDIERALRWKSSRYQSGIKKTEEVRRWGSYRVEAIHSKRLQWQKEEQNDGYVYQCWVAGVYMRRLLEGMIRGGSKGSHLCKPSAPVRTHKGWTVFGFVPQAWWVMWCSPVTPQSRGTLSWFSCRASSELPILRQPSFLQKMGLSPGKLTSSLHSAGPATFSDAAVCLWPTGSFYCIKDLSIYKSQVLKCFFFF